MKIFCRRRKEVQICTTSAAAASLIFVVAAGMNSVVVAEHRWKKVSRDGVPISAFRNFPKDGASLSHIDLGEDGHSIGIPGGDHPNSLLLASLASVNMNLGSSKEATAGPMTLENASLDVHGPSLNISRQTRETESISFLDPTLQKTL